MAVDNTEAEVTGQTEKAPKVQKPARRSRVLVEADSARVRLRLNKAQTLALLAALYKDGRGTPGNGITDAGDAPEAKKLFGAAHTELSAAMRGCWYYWDDTSVLFVTEPTAQSLYAYLFSLAATGGTAFLVGARALRKQMVGHGYTVRDLEAEAKAEAEKAKAAATAA
jgi:hypothetical protein